ncbi:MAG: MGMT family protein [Propionibacteriaceae bacterium]|nr:MGMT family protein [Propionibacteriaceae bacterium]
MGRTELAERVESLVADIPWGRVMTYGDVAAGCGYPGAARRVGAIAHQSAAELPWHRVVASGGRLAAVHDVPHQWQAKALASEGVSVREGRVTEFESVRWFPPYDLKEGYD